eukprot:g4661.t1
MNTALQGAKVTFICPDRNKLSDSRVVHCIARRHSTDDSQHGTSVLCELNENEASALSHINIKYIGSTAELLDYACHIHLLSATATTPNCVEQKKVKNVFIVDDFDKYLAYPSSGEDIVRRNQRLVAVLMDSCTSNFSKERSEKTLLLSCTVNMNDSIANFLQPVHVFATIKNKGKIDEQNNINDTKELHINSTPANVCCFYHIMKFRKSSTGPEKKD